MRGNRRLSVVILYTHALLGEGLAKLLAAEPGLEIRAIPTHDVGAAEAALSGEPDVVIFERHEPLQAIDLLRLAPNALLIDVGMDAGPTFSYQREEIPAKPEGIVRAIRHLRRSGRAAVVGALSALATAALPGGPPGGG
jgi:DNA-binding NarL/FixJ family response regulator